MKLYFHGHNYKYAAEQMLLKPHGMSHPAGKYLSLYFIVYHFYFLVNKLLNNSFLFLT